MRLSKRAHDFIKKGRQGRGFSGLFGFDPSNTNMQAFRVINCSPHCASHKHGHGPIVQEVQVACKCIH